MVRSLKIIKAWMLAGFLLFAVGMGAALVGSVSSALARDESHEYAMNMVALERAQRAAEYEQRVMETVAPIDVGVRVAWRVFPIAVAGMLIWGFATNIVFRPRPRVDMIPVDVLRNPTTAIKVLETHNPKLVESMARILEWPELAAPLPPIYGPPNAYAGMVRTAPEPRPVSAGRETVGAIAPNPGPEPKSPETHFKALGTHETNSGAVSHEPETAVSGHETGISEVADLVLKMRRQGFNKTQIIKTVWECSPGGSEAYAHASREYDSIIGAGA
jgi:hypothetical protein